MPESTKIIPFPSRAKPRALPARLQIVEFAELSDIIWSKPTADDLKHPVSTQGTGEIVGPTRPS